tara:strand:- start:437 stop:763 length:327 start_codon:yes stop_codon:yes gene_type:complete
MFIVRKGATNVAPFFFYEYLKDMPYNKRKQKCKQSDGDQGSYVLSYTDKKGKKHRACHTSKKKMQGQIAAIEMEADDSDKEIIDETKLIHKFIRTALLKGMYEVRKGL